MSGKNQRIVKNTLMLYIRMAINLAIGLYTSRVVLNVLGIDDYGVYGVVSGVIAMMGFLQASMSGATSRFLNYSLGENDELKLKQTFSTAVISHIGIALIILLVGETLGLWWVANKLVISPERHFAAKCVYHLSLLSSVIGISIIPYNATIIAHEKMNFYAMFEILKSGLNLAIVFVLMLGDYDKLILYGFLGLGVQIICSTITFLYSHRHFKEARSIRFFDKGIFKKMSTFLGQTVFAHLSFSFRYNGNNVVLNLLYGTAANAANGVAMTIQGVLLQFSSNINVAFTPQIIQEYSKGNYSRMNQLMLYGSRFSLLVVMFFVIPLWIEMPDILRLWLKIVPNYAVVFSRIILLTVIMSAITAPVYTGLTATGEIKKYSLFQGFVYLSVPFIFYFVGLKFNIPEIAYILVVLSQLLTATTLFIIMRRKISGFNCRSFLICYLKIAIIATICVSLTYWFSISFPTIPLRVVYVVLISIFAFGSLNYVILKRDEKLMLKRIITKRN